MNDPVLRDDLDVGEPAPTVKRTNPGYWRHALEDVALGIVIAVVLVGGAVVLSWWLA